MTITTRQTVLEYSDIRSLYKFRDENAIEDFAAMKSDLFAVLDLINNGGLSPIFGTGSPEGVVESNISLTYIDTTLSPVSVTMYVNQSINSTTGWVAVV